MHQPRRQPPRSTSRVLTRKIEEEKTLRFRRLLAISMMSALTLGAILIARAETWVTVNPDGSVTRTEAQVQTKSAAQTAPQYDDATRATQRALDDGEIYDSYPQDPNQQPTNIYNGNVYNGNIYNVYPNAPSTPSPGTVTFYSGSYVPVPTYSYGNGYGNYGYPYVTAGTPYVIGPNVPNNPNAIKFFPLPPRNGYSGYPAYNGYPVYNGYTNYPGSYPGYAYPPLIGVGSGTYYSGPIGGGGTIFSSSTSTSSGAGISLGNSGLNISIGGHHHDRSSSTTVVTTGGR